MHLQLLMLANPCPKLLSGPVDAGCYGRLCIASVTLTGLHVSAKDGHSDPGIFPFLDIN